MANQSKDPVTTALETLQDLTAPSNPVTIRMEAARIILGHCESTSPGPSGPELTES